MEEAADGVLYLAGAMGGGCESTIVVLHMCGWSYARTRPHRSKTAKASKAQGRSRRSSICSLGGLCSGKSGGVRGPVAAAAPDP